MLLMTRSVVVSGDATTFFLERFSRRRMRMETESDIVGANPS